MLKSLPCLKTINHGTMRNFYIKDAVKKYFLMGLDTVKFSPRKIISELKTIKTNSLFKNGNLKNLFCRHASLLDQQEADRNTLIMLELKEGVDLFQTNNKKLNMITLSITFTARENTIDDPNRTLPISIGYKGGFKNKSDNFYINSLNTMSSSKRLNFYFKNSNKYVATSVISIIIAMNQI